MTRTVSDSIPLALRDALGLGDDGGLTLVALDATPDIPVAHGLATGGETVDSLLVRFRLDPSRTPVDPAVTQGIPASIDIVRWATHPEMVSVRGDLAGVRFVGESVRVADDEVLIRPGTDGAAAIFAGAPERVLLFTPTEVRAYQRTETAMSPPPIDAIVGELPVPTWLVESATQLACGPHALSRVASAGLIARLWTLAPTEDRSAAEAITDMWRRTTRSRAVAWFRALSDAQRAKVLRDAVAESAALAEQLPSLSERLAADTSEAHDSALTWLHRRDDLASVAMLARTTRQSTDLDTALVALDRATALHHSMWAMVPGLSDDPRIAAVGWQEQDHWWGTLALP